MKSSWSAVPHGATRALELAYESLVAGGLAVGSAIVDHTGAVIAEGRNRAYDTATGNDALERTPIAHAEMNAMARLDTDVATESLTLWTTQQPCSMCRAAIDFVGIGAVRAIAADPSAPAEQIDEALGDVWVVLATAMFLAGPLRLMGAGNSMIRASVVREPESIDLAAAMIETAGPWVGHSSLVDGVGANWDELQSAAQQRRRRLVEAG